jgi:hypothetical protein
MRQARQELAARQITGGPEKHDDVRRDAVHSSPRMGAGRRISDRLNM